MPQETNNRKLALPPPPIASASPLLPMLCPSVSSSSRCPGGGSVGAPGLAKAERQNRSMPIPRRPHTPVMGLLLCAREPAVVASPGDGQRRWTNPNGDKHTRRGRWVRQPELHRRWVEAENATPTLSETVRGGGGGGDGGERGNDTVGSPAQSGSYNALKHRDLYSDIPYDVMMWGRRKELICQDIHNWNADIVCLQEVDRYNDLLSDLKREGYVGTFKRRTGNAVDGCAIFWREHVFRLLEEKSIEFKSFGLRDNIAQLCIFEMHRANTRRLLVGNIHALFNPNRGDIKLGQIRTFLWSAHALAEKWGSIPVVLAGDFNITPKSAVYEFLLTSQLNILMHDRKHLSGQNKCHPPPFVLPTFLDHSWTDEELKTATGNYGCTQLGHPLKLQSAYASIKGTSGTRGHHGEPLATTYHSKFLGTVDYLWYSVGLSPLRVLDTLPIYILRKTGGLPCKNIGSDHLALASEFIFTEEYKLKPQEAMEAKPAVEY